MTGFGAVDREQILILWRERDEGARGPPRICGLQTRGGDTGLCRARSEIRKEERHLNISYLSFTFLVFYTKLGEKFSF